MFDEEHLDGQNSFMVQPPPPYINIYATVTINVNFYASLCVIGFQRANHNIFTFTLYTSHY